MFCFVQLKECLRATWLPKGRVVDPYAEQLTVDSPFINSAEGDFSFKMRMKSVAQSFFSSSDSNFFAHSTQLVVFSTSLMICSFFFVCVFSARKTFHVSLDISITKVSSSVHAPSGVHVHF